MDRMMICCICSSQDYCAIPIKLLAVYNVDLNHIDAAYWAALLCRVTIPAGDMMAITTVSRATPEWTPIIVS